MGKRLWFCFFEITLFLIFITECYGMGYSAMLKYITMSALRPEIYAMETLSQTVAGWKTV